MLDIPSSARPAAPAGPRRRAAAALGGSSRSPDEPFAWRQVRRSGRAGLAGATLVLLRRRRAARRAGLRRRRVGAGAATAPWSRQPKALQAPDGATSLWAADPIVQSTAAPRRTRPCRRCSPSTSWCSTSLETGAAGAVGIQPPLRRRGRSGVATAAGRHAPGNPVAVAGSVPLRDVRGHPTVRVLGYQPEYDEASGRWFVDVALQETPALWPFVRLAVAPLPARLDRGLRAVAGRADQLGAAAADPDAHREPARTPARAGDADRRGRAGCAATRRRPSCPASSSAPTARPGDAAVRALEAAAVADRAGDGPEPRAEGRGPGVADHGLDSGCSR